MRRLIIAAFSSLALTSVVFSFLFSPQVHADDLEGSFILDSVSDNVTDYQLWRFYWGCGNDEVQSPLGGSSRNNGAIRPSQLNDHGIFAIANGSVEDIDVSFKFSRAVRGDMYDNPVADCGDSWIKEPFGRFGIKESFTEFYCKFAEAYNDKTGGLAKTVNGGSTAAACASGSKIDGSYMFFLNQDTAYGDSPTDGKTIVDETAKYFKQTKRGKNALDGLTNAERYVQAWRTFVVACSDVKLISKYPTDSDPAGDNPEVFKIAVVNQNGDLNYFKGIAGSSSTDKKEVRLESRVTTTCGDLAETLRNTADDYSKYVEKHKGEAGSSVGSADEDGGGDGDGSTTTCNIDGVGWIVCSAMTFIGKLNDKVFGFLNNFLEIKTQLLSNNGTQKAWTTFRDIANVAFVVAFLVLIYSQVTGGGITNYGIKKMLPKLVVAAILVNVSFIFCQLLVDISNILGNSIYNLFKHLPVGTETGDTSGGGWGDLVQGILYVGLGVGLLAVVLFAPSVLLIVGVVVMILIARQAILVLLVVISPLAFVAYLLPNTESWFKKWWKLFWSLLLLYPIVAALFGGGTLASHILSTVASESDSQMLGIAALAAMALPLLAIPSVLKGALSAAGSIGGKLAAIQDGAQNRAKGKAKEAYGNSSFAMGRAARKQEKANWRKRQFARAISGGDQTRLGRLRGVMGRGTPSITPGGRYARQAQRRNATNVADKIDADDVKAAESMLITQHGGDVDALNQSLEAAIASGDHVTARAAQNQLLRSSRGREAFHQTINRHHEAGTLNQGNEGMEKFLKDNVLANHNLKSKDATIDRWAKTASGEHGASGESLRDVAATAGVWNGLDDHELSGQSLESMTEAYHSGALTDERARRILASPEVAKNLNEQTRAALEELRDTGYSAHFNGRRYN